MYVRNLHDTSLHSPPPSSQELAFIAHLYSVAFANMTTCRCFSPFCFSEIHWSSLEALPEDLFADVPKLEILRVTSSKLSSLPAEIFAPLPYLFEL